MHAAARAAVADAAARVLHERREAWQRDALSEEEAARLMDRLVAIMAQGLDGEPVDGSGAEKTLLRRFIDLIRQELLCDPRGLGDGGLLTVMRRLEAVRDQLEPDWHQAAASQLTGANALDLVVEFAHDLRSPLTSIMFLAETLRKGQSGQVTEIQRQQLGIMYSAALGMVNVANDIMDLAHEQLDTSWENARPEMFSLRELVEGVRNMVAPMSEQKRLDVVFFTPEHDLRHGRAIPLNRTLLNLVTNAIKFTEHGQVDIVVRELRDRRVEFSVRDTGRGLDGETRDSLYETFRRSRSGTGFHFSGTGLGLAICRRMVEIMGGELQVESRPEGGTRFFFDIELPRA